MRILILGGDAAGMSAASRLVRKSSGNEVVVFEQSGEVSYGACGLPYYVGGVNDELDRMRIRKAEEFRAQGIDLRLFHEATAVDFSQKAVAVRHDGQTTYECYDKLLIGVGASPVRPPLPGMDLPFVYTLRTLQDGESLRNALDRPDCMRVAIVGGGYIGVELAEACLLRGKKTMLFEALPRLLNGFDADFGQAAKEELEQNGALVCVGEALAGIGGQDGKRTVRTDRGEYPVDVVVVVVGVRPNTRFLGDAQIERLKNGAIVTNERMETSVPDVYAAGDCAAVWHRVLNRPAYIPLGTNANKQGRFAADGMLGRDGGFGGALGTAMLRCVTLELAKTGIAKREALEAGFDADDVTVQTLSHAPYYPAPVPVTIRVCFERGTKRVLGAQIMGKGESAWRIDVFACAVDRGMTAGELGRLDLGYAPPFAAVWDAVQIAANAVP